MIMKTVDYFGTEKASFKGFCNFCKKNIPLLIAVTVALFFTYGAKLFWYTIGADTERYMAANRILFVDSEMLEGPYRLGVQGRFGLMLLQKLWYIKEFNPHTAFFTAFCFIWLFVVSWCYIIAVFNKSSTVQNNVFIPFALVFMTSAVWAEQFYWVLQAAEVAFIVFLCPYIIYLLYKGALDNKWGKMAISGVLLVFITSVYQGIVPLFCCGVLVCFLFLCSNSAYMAKVYRILCLKIFLTFLLAIIAYSALNGFLIAYVYKGVPEFSLMQWAKNSLRDNIVRILSLGYSITIGDIPVVFDFLKPVMLRFARNGESTLKTLGAFSRIVGNIFLLPIGVIFLAAVIRNEGKDVYKQKRVLYVLSGIGVPFCILLLPILRGAFDIRSQFVLPFATAFMLLYLMVNTSKKPAMLFAVLGCCIAMHQAQISAQLYYSDFIRYQNDVQLAFDLDKRIQRTQDNDEQLPIALIGAYTLPFAHNYVRGEALGRSLFEWSSNGIHESARHGLPFMQTLGLYHKMANVAQMEKARTAALFMPSYPADGCVQRLPDVIVVKLSDSTYKPKEP
jgi:hypothetical protein